MVSSIVENNPAYTEWKGRWTLPSSLLTDRSRLIIGVNRARCIIVDAELETISDSKQVLVWFWFDDSFEPGKDGLAKTSNSVRFVIPLGTCFVIEETAL